MNNLTEILKSIIDKIDLKLKISYVDGSRVYLKNTIHLTISKIVSIEGYEYKVKSFIINKYVDLEPIGHSEIIPADSDFLIAPSITFLHGQPKSTNAEYLQLDSLTSAKTPFIWLVESYDFEEGGVGSSIANSYKVRLFLLDWANEREWMNKDHNTNVISPMNNLLRAFKEVISKDFIFKRVENYNVVVRPRFGVETSSKNTKSKIIDEDLSGIEVSFNLEKYKEDNC